MGSKKNPLQEIKCMKKRAYESKAVAESAIDEMESHHAIKQRVYQCRFCSAWHTSTIRNGKSRKLKPSAMHSRGVYL